VHQLDKFNDAAVFAGVKKKIEMLREECYALKDGKAVDIQDNVFTALSMEIQEKHLLMRPEGAEGLGAHVQLQELPEMMPRTDQLLKFSLTSAYKCDALRARLEGNNFDKAFFLNQHALEFSYLFQIKLKHVFRNMGHRITGNLKSNMARIAQKIGENAMEKDGPFRITDMLRATVVCNEVADLEVAY